MSDVAVLGLVVVALYLSECLVWARHGAVVARAPWFLGSARVAPLARAFGTKSGAFAPLNPLPPFGRVYVVEPWPFAMSVDGVVAASSFALERAPRAPSTAKVLAWPAVVGVGARDKDVVVDGAVFARTSSKRHAAAAASILAGIAGAAADARAGAIDAALDTHLDVDGARALVERHARVGIWAASAASAVFAALFVATPREVSAHGLERWPAIVGTVYVCVFVTAVAAFFAHRALYRGAIGERIAQAALMLPAPTISMRANDKLGRHLLAGLHPVAAALALDDNAVAAMLRDLAFPRPLALEDNGARIERDFRARLLDKAKLRAVAHGVDVDAVFAAPDDGATWCPRCRAVYRARDASAGASADACSDCAVPLVAARGAA